jgi:hypothetical protein
LEDAAREDVPKKTRTQTINLVSFGGRFGDAVGALSCATQ